MLVLLELTGFKTGLYPPKDDTAVMIRVIKTKESTLFDMLQVLSNTSICTQKSDADKNDKRQSKFLVATLL